jgi:hypothetical protein
MSRNINNILRFIGLLLIQVTILNRINFGGFINPQIYVLYVILFPYYNKNKGYFLLSSFFLGISIDFFMNSGGINAFSLTLIAFFRQTIFNMIIGKQDKNESISFHEIPMAKAITYILILTFIHTTSIFWLENFSFDQLGLMFIRIILSTIYSTVIIYLSLSLFLNKK